jgi:hypothetical protein
MMFQIIRAHSSTKLNLVQELRRRGFDVPQSLVELYSQTNGGYLAHNTAPFDYAETLDVREILPLSTMLMFIDSWGGVEELNGDVPFGDSEYIGHWFLRKKSGTVWHVVLRDVVHFEEEELETHLTLEQFADTIQYQETGVTSEPTFHEYWQQRHPELQAIGYRRMGMQIASAIADEVLDVNDEFVWSAIKECYEHGLSDDEMSPEQVRGMHQSFDKANKLRSKKRSPQVISNQLSKVFDVELLLRVELTYHEHFH